MAHLKIDGPIEISDSLAQLLFEAMTEVGKSGVAQMFASRLISGPLSDKAIEAAAKVYMEKAEIPQAGAKALRDGVAAKCQALGEESVNPEHLKALIATETRKAAEAVAQEKIADVFAAIPMADLIAAAAPAINKVVGTLAEKYFMTTQEGQGRIMDILNDACENGRERLDGMAATQFDAAVKVKRPVGRPRKVKS